MDGGQGVAVIHVDVQQLLDDLKALVEDRPREVAGRRGTFAVRGVLRAGAGHREEVGPVLGVVDQERPDDPLHEGLHVRITALAAEQHVQRPGAER